MKINSKQASHILRQEAYQADDGNVDPEWYYKVGQLSELCEACGIRSAIPFLGTTMLARSVSARVDPFACKPSHAGDNPNAYSARSLSERVLVPLAAELGIHLGVTGRQPMNNQPFFRMRRLGDGTPVREDGRPAFDYMYQLVEELSHASEQEARQALRAFVAVRRAYQPRYTQFQGLTRVAPEALTTLIGQFVAEESEQGKRAQAIVAGLMDVYAGPHRVDSGRINDPSRRHPGDVCVQGSESGEAFEKAIEVRDKPVSLADVQIFAKKCVDMGVQECALVMVSDRQEELDGVTLATWADSFGIGLTLFVGWTGFVNQCLYWSAEPKPVAAAAALETINDRLVEVEVSAESLARWQQRARSTVSP